MDEGNYKKYCTIIERDMVLMKDVFDELKII